MKMFKKILPALLTLFIILSPLMTHAAGLPTQIVTCGGSGPNDHVCGICDLANVIQNILALLTYVFMVGFSIMIAWTGGKLLFNNGNANQIAQAKKSIQNIGISVIAVLGAWFIINLLMSAALGKQGGAPWNRICAGFSQSMNA